MRLTVITPTADILGEPAEPDIISQKDSQLIYGEQFDVYESHGAYVYGQSFLDGYKGYVERDQLVRDTAATNYIVKARATHLYPVPSFKSRPLLSLSFMSRLNVEEKSENGFRFIDDGSWVFEDHITEINNFKMPEDLAQTATIYLNTPYLFGGRSTFGIDCSGIVQQCILAHGNACPVRNSCNQEGSFGTKVELKDIQRNDVVFFKGHVGIMMDDEYLLNATARHMTTVIEKLSDVEKAYEGGITHIARL